MAPQPAADPAGPADAAAAAGTGTPADRVLTAAIRHSAGRAAAICLLAAASAAASVALPAALGHTLDLALDGSGEAARWTALCALLVAAEVLLDAVSAHLTGTTDARSTAWLRRRGLEHLLAVGPRRAARFPHGDLVTRLSGNAAEAGAVPTTAATAVSSLLTPLGALVALLLVDPWLAAAFCAGVPLLVLLLRAFARGSSDSVSRYQRVQGEIAARLVEALAGARTLAAAGTAGRERARVLAPLPELAAQGRRMWHVYGQAMVGSGVLVPLLTIAVLAMGGVRLTAGELSVGELLAVPPVAYGRRTLPPDGTGRLELRGVTAVRGGREVLRGVDLVVPGGATMAVVGRSGSGKSTLAALAGRLADPDEGRVLLDGIPLDGLDPAELRREVGYAFERPALFGDTVGEAVAFGAYDPGPGAVEDAARAASADAFVRRLPAGYGTALADAPLSGGEFQRLGLARAFAHAGRLLVLDDATSSLDSVTELQVSRALTDRVRAGTRLLIAHRVSSAARADLVAWLEEGRVRAVGPHEALWELPEYRAAFTAGDGPGVSDGPDDLDTPDALDTPGAPGGPAPRAARAAAEESR
ncbi:ABC transporter ATP-binding protein [Streptomyces atacamensis]|uniref:ABC transporter ATP-binding protein n=1 Tax=Streptomyces atacamensis TaxID=531966 RepID=UPI00399CDA5B